MGSEGPVVVLISQVVALLIGGRLLGELLQRFGQPPVMGQILAGVLLGPSILGALAPHWYPILFPSAHEQKAMLDAIAQVGILLLLLMTGMETDLSIFRDTRRAAVSISLTGILIPFACGVVLGELLPPSLLPTSGNRLITVLFLGTALSISSVKIVALVVRDLGFLRRTVGQVIIAAAVLDDTIGWIIMSITFGLALHGTIDLGTVARSTLGTAAFLALSFTFGRRLVFNLIRWSNDHFISEMSTITVILVITGAMALVTAALGVHLILGAFVAGILIGQSPILTRRIDAQLRGLIVALFMPVFFGLAGLTADLASLGKPGLLLLTLGLILLASIGKFAGAFLGGRIGGLSTRESLAVGCGMNARGSTEVIVASIGLSMGALTKSLYTSIVAMAVVTTMVMPPMLRWSLRRLPLSPDEKERLEREDFAQQSFLAGVERMLVAADESANGRFARHLASLIARLRQTPTTFLSPTDSVANEARKGYGLLLIGREPAAHEGRLDPQISRDATDFGGPFCIALAQGPHANTEVPSRLRVLVPITGTRASRQGAEMAIALAQASYGTVTAIHISGPTDKPIAWSRHFDTALAPEKAALAEIERMGEHYGVEVRGALRRSGNARAAILQEIKVGHHDLLVMGVSPHSSERLFFGEVAAGVLAGAQCSLLLLSGEPVTGAAETQPHQVAAAEAHS
ncbi:MAG TPA: cation:proton antiporter [Steroidobacteraceae bacterium]|jgi:Kef-type K+ transport system membrane component KefB/nucleotide-binding universal stress UspA family protein